MKKILSAIAAVTFVLTFSLAGLTPVAHADDLSNVGKQAFIDLTRCINTKHVLNIYYLIDESGSLQDTDKNGDRASILATSVKSLGTFRSDVKVNYGVGFFGDKFDPWKSFSSIDANNANDAASQIASEVSRSSRASTYNTNWQLGIEGAAKALQDQAASHPGCQSLIWLTDGGLWIGKNGSPSIRDDAATQAAQKVLCDSTFEGLRTSNISVFGVLLRNDQALADLQKKNPTEYNQNVEYMSKMRPLVEGEGNGERACGTIPIPQSSSAGALLIATDPVALALQFLIITSSTEGGAQTNLPPGNPTHFTIEPGIRQFRLLTTSSKWTLTGPNGAQYGPGSPQLNIQNTSGVQQITVDQKIPLLGNWTFGFNNGAINRLLLYSGLDIKLDPGQLIAGSNGKISGHVVVQNNASEKVDLSVYGLHPFGIQELLTNNQSSDISGTSIANDGSFTATYQPAPNQGKLELRVTLQLRTKAGVELAPVSVSQFLEVKLPTDYPSTESPVHLSDMNGKSAARGSILLHGPLNGAGSICIPTVPNYNIVVTKDSIDRRSLYKWTIAGQASSGCIELSQNQSLTLNISASNSKPSDSNVEAGVPITFKSAAHSGADITLNIPIAFKSSIVRVASGFITFLLFLLGIGIPILGTYLLYWNTTKFAFGSGIQRAAYKVKVDSLKGVTMQDGSPITPKFDDFKLISNQPDTRSYKEEIGEMRMHLSPIPLVEPWFELSAAAGTRVITMIAPPQGAKKRFLTGQIAPIKGDMNTFWALSIQETELMAAANRTAVPAYLVIYKRNKFSNPNQFQDRVFEVIKVAGIWNRITELRATPLIALKEKTAKTEKAAKGSKSAKGNTRADASASSTTVPTPPLAGMPSGLVPPPPIPGAGQVPPPPPMLGGKS
jgi:hypothetical protein